MIEVHQSLRHDNTGRLGSSHNLIAFGHTEAQWLFAQHVFACPGSTHRPLGMEAIGQGDIDYIDPGIG